MNTDNSPASNPVLVSNPCEWDGDNMYNIIVGDTNTTLESLRKHIVLLKKSMVEDNALVYKSVENVAAFLKLHDSFWSILVKEQENMNVSLWRQTSSGANRGVWLAVGPYRKMDQMKYKGC
jgi:hypothetical protein